VIALALYFSVLDGNLVPGYVGLIILLIIFGAIRFRYKLG
jgi:hypothetical protein